MNLFWEFRNLKKHGCFFFSTFLIAQTLLLAVQLGGQGSLVSVSFWTEGPGHDRKIHWQMQPEDGGPRASWTRFYVGVKIEVGCFWNFTNQLGWFLHPIKSGGETSTHLKMVPSFFLQQKICLRISFKNPSSCQKIEKLPSWPKKIPGKADHTKSFGKVTCVSDKQFSWKPQSLVLWCMCC